MEPESFGPYRLEELIGRGGMGEVHRAVDTVRQRVVAIKRLQPHLAADRLFRARFRKEAALAAQLRDPHVIPIHDFGEVDGRLFIDMRLVDGRNLGVLLAAEGPLPPQRAVEIVAQVASGLDAAHSAGLVHRDIKPSNVLVSTTVDGQDFAYIADFGVARAIASNSGTALTATGAAVGTLDYMAPERFAGQGDGRMDVYSLGCLLYELLTGRKPYPGEELLATVNAHLNFPPPRPTQVRPDLPPALDAVVITAMANDPAQRYPTAGALAVAARRALAAGVAPLEPGRAGQPSFGAHTPVDPTAVVTPPPARPSPPYAPLVPSAATHRAPRRKRRIRGLVVAGALAVLLAAGAVVGYLIYATGGREVTLLAASSNGPDPFGPDFTTAGGTSPMAGAPPGSGSRVRGNTEGLYAAESGAAVCDRAALSGFLARDPQRAAAFAGALVTDPALRWSGEPGLTTVGVARYLEELTPVRLRADTVVTAHRFSDGAAEPFAATLQAGSAVLVDVLGVPRVRCAGVDPLTEPAAVASPEYTGTPWAGFAPGAVTAVVVADPVVEFALADPKGELFRRPAGTLGPADFAQRPDTGRLAGSYELTGSQTKCVNIIDCDTSADWSMTIEVANCPGRCEAGSRTGDWDGALALTASGSAMRVTGNLAQAASFTCDGAVDIPSTFVLDVTVDESRAVDGRWTATAVTATYTRSKPPGTCGGSSTTHALTGTRG